jgi:DNA-binding GntR family transcriptional regulator
VVEKLAGSAADLGALDRMLALQAAAAEIDDYATFFQHDEAFHAKLAELAGTPTIWKLVQSVKGHVDRQRYSMMAGIPMRSRRAYDEHLLISDRIRNGDVAGASKAMADHVASVLELEQ